VIPAGIYEPEKVTGSFEDNPDVLGAYKIVGSYVTELVTAMADTLNIVPDEVEFANMGPPPSVTEISNWVVEIIYDTK
jgi:uncharacterized membrane protein